MTRILTTLSFLLALAAGAPAQNPLANTEPDPVEEGSWLNITYESSRTESSVDIEIYNDAEELVDTVTIQLTDGDGTKSWWVDENMGTEFLTLEDDLGNLKNIRPGATFGDLHPPRYYRWADLIKRVFEVDVLVCEHCGGPRRVLTFLTDPPVLRAILEHLGLPADPPVISPARAPPQPELPFDC